MLARALLYLVHGLALSGCPLRDSAAIVCPVQLPAYCQHISRLVMSARLAALGPVYKVCACVFCVMCDVSQASVKELSGKAYLAF